MFVFSGPENGTTDIPILTTAGTRVSDPNTTGE